MFPFGTVPVNLYRLRGKSFSHRRVKLGRRSDPRRLAADLAVEAAASLEQRAPGGGNLWPTDERSLYRRPQWKFFARKGPAVGPVERRYLEADKSLLTKGMPTKGPNEGASGGACGKKIPGSGQVPADERNAYQRPQRKPSSRKGPQVGPVRGGSPESAAPGASEYFIECPLIFSGPQHRLLAEAVPSFGALGTNLLA